MIRLIIAATSVWEHVEPGFFEDYNLACVAIAKVLVDFLPFFVRQWLLKKTDVTVSVNESIDPLIFLWLFFWQTMRPVPGFIFEWFTPIKFGQIGSVIPVKKTIILAHF